MKTMAATIERGMQGQLRAIVAQAFRPAGRVFAWGTSGAHAAQNSSLIGSTP